MSDQSPDVGPSVARRMRIAAPCEVGNREVGEWVEAAAYDKMLIELKRMRGINHELVESYNMMNPFMAKLALDNGARKLREAQAAFDEALGVVVKYMPTDVTRLERG
jgi:hypothetical protein